MKFYNIFPQKEGWFWLYGRVWGDDEPEFHAVDVIKIANGYLHKYASAHLTEEDIEGDFWFFEARMPKIPETKE